MHVIIYDIRGAIRNTWHGSANFAGDSNDARPKLVRVCTIKTWPIMYFLRSHASDLYLENFERFRMIVFAREHLKIGIHFTLQNIIRLSLSVR